MTTVMLVALMMLGFYYFFGRGSSGTNKVETPMEFRAPAQAPNLTGGAAVERQMAWLGSTELKAGYKMAVQITNVNAGVERAELTGYWATYKKKDQFAILQAEAGLLPPFATLWVDINEKGQKAQRYDLRGLPWKMEAADNEVKLYTFIDLGEGRKVTIWKIYHLAPGSYDLQITHRITNGWVEAGKLLR